jgi:hypothetical protein
MPQSYMRHSNMSWAWDKFVLEEEKEEELEAHLSLG